MPTPVLNEEVEPLATIVAQQSAEVVPSTLQVWEIVLRSKLSEMIDCLVGAWKKRAYSES
jgi:hypothetical protein